MAISLPSVIRPEWKWAAAGPGGGVTLAHDDDCNASKQEKSRKTRTKGRKGPQTHLGG